MRVRMAVQHDPGIPIPRNVPRGYDRVVFAIDARYGNARSDTDEHEVLRMLRDGITRDDKRRGFESDGEKQSVQRCNLRCV